MVVGSSHMKDFIGMEHMFDEEVCRRTDHRFHAKGNLLDHEWINRIKTNKAEMKALGERQPWWGITDQTWVICLYHAKILSKDDAAKLLRALEETKADSGGVSGEERLAPILEEGMDLASAVNYGRTLQEPMSRLKMRDKLIDVFEDIFELIETVQRVASENLDTIMVGYTHMNHGQPITLAHFLMGIHDGFERGLQQLEMAYSFVNRNTGGCGSCSGITWEVDRALQAELLGMDGVVEPTYECEAAQDHSMSAVFALTNICTLISQAAMYAGIWSMDEVDMMRTHPGWCGVSSFMPQKCDSGSNYERTRIYASDVMGDAVKCLFQLRGEPYGDMLPMYHLPEYALEGIVHARLCMQFFSDMLSRAIPQKERMLEIVREGYSCATEVATHLIREKGYGGRMAHTIVATMIRQARVKGLKSYECTGQMLGDAAEYVNVRKPGLDDETLRKLFDPVEFIYSHTHTGGTAPSENARLLEIRKKRLAEARERQAKRKAQIADAEAKREAEISKICSA